MPNLYFHSKKRLIFDACQLGCRGSRPTWRRAAGSTVLRCAQNRAPPKIESGSHGPVATKDTSPLLLDNHRTRNPTGVRLSAWPMLALKRCCLSRVNLCLQRWRHPKAKRAAISKGNLQSANRGHIVRTLQQGPDQKTCKTKATPRALVQYTGKQ